MTTIPKYNTFLINDMHSVLLLWAELSSHMCCTTPRKSNSFGCTTLTVRRVLWIFPRIALFHQLFQFKGTSTRQTKISQPKCYVAWRRKVITDGSAWETRCTNISVAVGCFFFPPPNGEPVECVGWLAKTQASTGFQLWLRSAINSEISFGKFTDNWRKTQPDRYPHKMICLWGEFGPLKSPMAVSFKHGKCVLHQQHRQMFRQIIFLFFLFYFFCSKE